MAEINKIDIFVSKIASLGVPALVLMVAINATGLYGAAAITTALAALGPFGIGGGIATLGVMSIIAEAITEIGMETIFRAVVIELYNKGETKDSIIRKINNYPISKRMKIELHSLIDSLDDV